VRTADTAPVDTAELSLLFDEFRDAPALLLAVSGGPDSTALMLLAARWRDLRKRAPALIAVTVDHGLRKEAKQEAAAVAKLARKLKVAHRTLRWAGKKPKSGIQQAARMARYRLLAQAAREAGAHHILTAHTRDDQAETVLIRMARGSGITGLGAMARVSALPAGDDGLLKLVRPLLDIPKARLIATLKSAKISFAEDPSNRDPRFTRARVRPLMHLLEDEGITAARLALLARRLKRADAALEAAVDRAFAEIAQASAPKGLVFDAVLFAKLPAEVAIRLLGRAVRQIGDEGPVELAKLESLADVLAAAQKSGLRRLRRSLAGALVTLSKSLILVERAPPRRGRNLTKRR
jgi:tRNA(Ile)-lysidine synthase